MFQRGWKLSVCTSTVTCSRPWATTRCCSWQRIVWRNKAWPKAPDISSLFRFRSYSSATRLFSTSRKTCCNLRAREINLLCSRKARRCSPTPWTIWKLFCALRWNPARRTTPRTFLRSSLKFSENVRFILKIIIVKFLFRVIFWDIQMFCFSVCSRLALESVDDGILCSCVNILEKVLQHDCFTSSQKEKVQQWRSRLGNPRPTPKWELRSKRKQPLTFLSSKVMLVKSWKLKDKFNSKF